MKFVAESVSRDTYVNVMEQYRPEHKAVHDKKYGLDRQPTRRELESALKAARASGVRRFDHAFDW